MLKRIASWDLMEWFTAIVMVVMVVSLTSEAIDWLDQRSCRVGGGRVVHHDHDWRCERGQP